MNESVKNTISQGMLAKLLASENIQIHVGNYRSAFFDVKNRILGLPTWNVQNKNVSDLLIGHEVGHALYTPLDGIEKFKADWSKIPFSILNVVEDIRIERLIQSRYPGLVINFNRGYEEFLHRDFFKIAGKNINKLGFADRLNIKGKLRHLVDVEFTTEENVIFDRCCNAETFDEVVEIVIDIYEMVKNKNRANNSETQAQAGYEPEIDPMESGQSSNDEPNDEAIDESSEVLNPRDEEDTESSTDFSQQDDTSDDNKSSCVTIDAEDNIDENNKEFPVTPEIVNDNSSHPTDYKSVEDELESGSLNSLEDSLSDLQVEYGKVNPVLMPSMDHINQVVIGWKRILSSRNSRENYMSAYLNDANVHNDWKQYKKNTRKNIQNLITDFERRKAAWQYSRSETSDTGDIDVNRLHAYKYDDSIFNTITKLADAKSHGMMFFIDYSGSMADDIHNVLDHTLSLVMFCKAVAIPFSVYTFTTAYHRSLDRSDIPSNQISLANTCICELLSSEMPVVEYELACRHLRGLIHLSVDVSFMGSKWETMSATPITETLIVAHELVARFRKKYHIQKMNVIFLSDGEGQSLDFGYDYAYTRLIKNESTRFKSMYSSQLQGHEIIFTSDANHTYATLVRSLRHTMGCTVIGFFITHKRHSIKSAAITSLRYAESHGAASMKIVDWRTSSALADKKLKTMRKNKFMLIKDGFNFNSYFIIDARSARIEEDAVFNPPTINSTSTNESLSGADQNKLAKEFTKYNLDKKSNRLILAKFAELVA